MIPSAINWDEISYGSARIHYSILYSQRRTVSITVKPDGQVLIKVPNESARETIAKWVRRRAEWILRQKDRFQRISGQIAPPRQYVSGETHYYLGRQYRLKVVESTESRVSLQSGRIYIYTKDTVQKEVITAQLLNWYRQRASRIILPLFARCIAKLPIADERREQIKIRLVRMERRWGSCSPAGIVRLNPELIKVPKACIEYIIWHELAHLIEPSHDKHFYKLQSQLMPDWSMWEERLQYFDLE